MELTPFLLILVAVVGWGVGDVFARKALFGARAETVLAVIVAVLALSIGTAGLVFEGAGAFWPVGPRFLALTALMAVLSWASGALLQFHALRLVGVVIASPLIGTLPFFAIAMAVLLGGERPSTATLVGAALVVVGAGLLVGDRRRVLR